MYAGGLSGNLLVGEQHSCPFPENRPSHVRLDFFILRLACKDSSGMAGRVPAIAPADLISLDSITPPHSQPSTRVVRQYVGSRNLPRHARQKTSACFASSSASWRVSQMLGHFNATPRPDFAPVTFSLPGANFSGIPKHRLDSRRRCRRRSSPPGSRQPFKQSQPVANGFHSGQFQSRHKGVLETNRRHRPRCSGAERRSSKQSALFPYHLGPIRHIGLPNQQSFVYLQSRCKWAVSGSFAIYRAILQRISAKWLGGRGNKAALARDSGPLHGHTRDSSAMPTVTVGGQGATNLGIGRSGGGQSPPRQS